MLRNDEIAAAGGIVHGFFTREGGVSEGIYASLNCGFGSRDAKPAVAENRARAMAALALDSDALATAYQVHGTDVLVLEAADRGGGKADAMVTRSAGVALGILTADCAPVLFADPGARVIGAAHAGWRGALAGVLEATVAAMERLGAARSRTLAAVGPCIAQASYEVGPEFPAPFLAEDEANRRWFAPADDPVRSRFDLEGYVAAKLAAIGLAAVGVSRADTCSETGRFFSYRRSRLRGEPDYGRALSAIALAP